MNYLPIGIVLLWNRKRKYILYLYLF